jgi:hypothetical protein
MAAQEQANAESSLALVAQISEQQAALAEQWQKLEAYKQVNAGGGGGHMQALCCREVWLAIGHPDTAQQELHSSAPAGTPIARRQLTTAAYHWSAWFTLAVLITAPAAHRSLYCTPNSAQWLPTRCCASQV